MLLEENTGNESQHQRKWKEWPWILMNHKNTTLFWWSCSIFKRKWFLFGLFGLGDVFLSQNMNLLSCHSNLYCACCCMEMWLLHCRWGRARGKCSPPDFCPEQLGCNRPRWLQKGTESFLITIILQHWVWTLTAANVAGKETAAIEWFGNTRLTTRCQVAAVPTLLFTSASSSSFHDVVN